jgi:hypothetical protein
MTSTGALIAALQAREVEKVSQGCPFNRTGLSLDEPPRTPPITDKTEIPRHCPLLEVPLYITF